MTEDQQLSALLRLKRYEQPPSGYYQKLLQDVHRRQRAELLKRPLWKIAVERLQTFFSEHSMSGLSYAGAMAAVAVAGLLAINTLGTSSGISGGQTLAQAPAPTLPAVAEVAPSEPAPSTALAQIASTRTPTVDLRAETPGLPRLLSLEESPVEVTTTSAEDDEALANARLSPSRTQADGGATVRQPRYVIDARPPSFEATKVSFSF